MKIADSAIGTLRPTKRSLRGSESQHPLQAVSDAPHATLTENQHETRRKVWRGVYEREDPREKIIRVATDPIVHRPFEDSLTPIEIRGIAPSLAPSLGNGSYTQCDSRHTKLLRLSPEPMRAEGLVPKLLPTFGCKKTILL